MINNKIKLLIISLFLIVFVSVSLVSAGCCEKLESGQWCQSADEESECSIDSRFASTACESTEYCQIGTCVNSQTGKCSINVPQTKCVEEGGVWKQENPLEIPACQQGCCSYGSKTAFVNQVECKQIASDEGVDVDFDSNIKSQEQCYALADSKEEGACIVQSEYEKTCVRRTKEECLNMQKSKASSKVLDILNIPSEESSINVNFIEGSLCAAEDLETDCAPTNNTRCYDDKVYFVDSCGNLANIYDEKMLPVDDEESRDYWSKIQKAKCTIDGTTSSTCGDCSYRTGTTCSEYDKSDGGMPSSSPKCGNKVCRDLACYYKDERYEHGESWCAETIGTYSHLEKDFEKDQETMNELVSLKGITEKYNIPGSRYVKLECRNGVVLEQPCKDYRNAFCTEEVLAETKQGDKKYTKASCIANGWRNCFKFTKQKNCEDSDDLFQCKWVPGYRFDFKNVKTNDAPLDYSKQGSCVPLIAPGFNFWNSSGNSRQGMIKENVFYEVHWTDIKGREELVSDAKKASQRCYSGNCYAIPGYGSGISENDWKKIWKGRKNADVSSEDYLSQRKGHYCHKKGKDGQPKTGRFYGDKPDCITNNKKIYQPPIFMNNADWIESLILRARSLGDVGYKQSVGNYWGDTDKEKVFSVMQKLNQDMEVKENLTEEFTMWEAGKFSDENKRMKDWRGKVFSQINGGGNIKNYRR